MILSKKLMFVLGVALSPVVMVACDDSSNDTKQEACSVDNCAAPNTCVAGKCTAPEAECVTGEPTNACQGDQILECVSGSLQPKDCETGKSCKAGVCVEPACKDDYVGSCEGKTSVLCVKNEIVRTPCASGEICTGEGKCEDDPSICEEECGAGLVCVNNVCEDDPSICEEECGTGLICVNNVCEDDPNICEEECGTGRVCVNNVCVDKECPGGCADKQECVQGQCVDIVTCDPACEEGYKCEGTTCVLDGDCDSKTFTKTCGPDGKSEVTCVKNSFVNTPCEGVKVCKNNACSDPVGILEKNLGASCHCEGSGCKVMGVPVPHGGTKVGCENVSEAAAPGSFKVCLQTINSSLAPKTYFNNGYCSLSAASCEPITSINVCSNIKYGDFDKMTTCPAGNVMITGSFIFKGGLLIGEQKIKNKVCAPKCEVDTDCRPDDNIKCVSPAGVTEKFCYDVRNFALYTEGIEVTAF